MVLARIKKGDMVQVISGRDKGKTGKILDLLTKKERVLVEHLNMMKRHTKPRKQGEQGGIIEKEAGLPVSVVMPYCAKCGKGVRVKIKLDKSKNKHRACAKCGHSLEGK